MSIFGTLPQYLIAAILDYDQRFVIKNGRVVYRDGKLLLVRPIDTSDTQYDCIRRLAKHEIYSNTIEVVLGINTYKNITIIYSEHQHGTTLSTVTTKNYRNFRIAEIVAAHTYHIEDGLISGFDEQEEYDNDNYEEEEEEEDDW